MPCEFTVKIVGKKGHIHWEVNGGHLHCYVTSEPLSEDANRELIKYIAESVGVSHSKVRLIHGVEDHTKTFKITDHEITLDDVMQALNIKKA